MKLRHIILPLTIAATAAAPAQDLNTEITVEREVVPQQQGATRLPLLPALSLPKVAPVTLSVSDRYEATAVPSYLSRLEPAPYGTTRTAPDYRGYIEAGYFPIYNLGVSAGYRFTPGPATDIDVFGQFNGHSYKGHLLGGDTDADKATLNRNTITAGTHLTHRFSGQSRLKAHLNYTFSAWNLPYPVVNCMPEDPGTEWDPIGGTCSENLTSHRIDLGGEWAARIGRTDITAGLDYGMLSFGGMTDAIAENRGRIHASGMWNFNEVSSWGADVSMSVVNDSPLSLTKSMVRIAPRYTYAARRFHARLGASIDLPGGNRSYATESRTSPLFAPDIALTWTPSGSFAIWGRFSGEMTDNSVASVYDCTPYFVPVTGYGFSRLPVNADLGITLGPWRGASLELRGGYSNAEDWLMPDPGVMYAMKARDVDGLHYGATLSYRYRRYLDLKVSYDAASHSSDHGYYLWRDGARSQFKAEIGTSPIEALNIRLSYSYREGRRQGFGEEAVDLGCISDLGLSAHYAISSSLGVFARGENLLNRHYLNLMALPGQGVRGLIGITYKFK